MCALLWKFSNHFLIVIIHVVHHRDKFSETVFDVGNNVKSLVTVS